MCSAGECRLIGVSVARLVESCHGCLGEVAASDRPLVVLVGEHGPDQSDRCRVVGEDPDDVAASLHFLVEAFERVVRPDLAPVSRGERTERQHVAACPAHGLGGFGEPLGEGVGDFVPAGLDLGSGAEREDLPERRGDHLNVGFGDGGQQVAGVVHPAALPRCSGEALADRRGQPGVRVGDHEADPAEAAVAE